ncbi:MAG: hypothetical protein ACFFG0_11650 [Candidatus Thorarchaeota archaeon]
MTAIFLPMIIYSWKLGDPESSVKSLYLFTNNIIYRVGKWKIAWLLNKRIISFNYNEVSYCQVKPLKKIIIFKKSTDLEITYKGNEEAYLKKLETNLDNHCIMFNAKNEKEKFEEILQFLTKKVPLAQHPILTNIYYSI